MGLQRDADTNSPTVTDGGAGRGMPCPTGPGGNSCLSNQDDAEIIEASYETTPIRYEGYAENSSSVQPQWREQTL